jgi:hypothetical protein
MDALYALFPDHPVQTDQLAATIRYEQEIIQFITPEIGQRAALVNERLPRLDKIPEPVDLHARPLFMPGGAGEMRRQHTDSKSRPDQSPG